MKKIPWIIFGAMLLFAILYVARTVAELPPLVASHFDGSGNPNAYMTRSVGYGVPMSHLAWLRNGIKQVQIESIYTD